MQTPEHGGLAGRRLACSVWDLSRRRCSVPRTTARSRAFSQSSSRSTRWSPNSRSFPTKASSKRRPSCANARRMARSSTILLPEAFANCREAARRALGLRAFDVQLVGGIFLHRGNIAEMKTGEGKTLVATFPAYLNALSGKGVHIVTVNDYLAKRDAEWMGQVYAALGLTTGVVYPRQPDSEKKEAYAADITYATNNELGFDYLRDNMRASLEEMAQRGAQLRHRGRGRLDPDRRGADAADHLGAQSGPFGSLCFHRQGDPASHRGTLCPRREAAQRDLHRRGQRFPRGQASRDGDPA